MWVVVVVVVVLTTRCGVAVLVLVLVLVLVVLRRVNPEFVGSCRQFIRTRRAVLPQLWRPTAGLAIPHTRLYTAPPPLSPHSMVAAGWRTADS